MGILTRERITIFVVFASLVLVLGACGKGCSKRDKDWLGTGGENGTPTVRDVPVLVLNYFPTKDGVNLDSSVTGITATLASIRATVSSLTDDTIAALNAGSAYHGYKDGSATPSLNYTIHETKEFLYAIPKSVDFPPFADHIQILNDLNIQDYVDNKGVKEVWIWMYHTAEIVPIESNMSMGQESKTFWTHAEYGDVSNSYRQNDLPVCQKTYTVYDYNYGRGVDCSLENHGHHLEAVFRWVDEDLFWNRFVCPHGETDGTVNHCGWTHCPPNTKSGYDWYNTTLVPSNAEDWHPDGSGEVKQVNRYTWESAWPDSGGGVGFKVWWMQNLPGRDNGLSFQGNNLRNWWDFIADFDQALKSGKTFYK